MGIPAAIIGSTIATSLLSSYQQHQQAKEQKALKKEEEKTLIAKKQAQSEQTPQLLAQAGTSDAVKKKLTSYGIQESVLGNQNTLGQKEVWG